LRCRKIDEGGKRPEKREKDQGGKKKRRGSRKRGSNHPVESNRRLSWKGGGDQFLSEAKRKGAREGVEK